VADGDGSGRRRSPLHRLLSRDLLLLTYAGRKSGRPHVVPLSYVEADGRLVLCTRPGVSRWWRNLRPEAPVELRLRGRRCAARAEVLDPASPEALAGLGAFLTRNPRTGEMLYGVRTDAMRRPLDDDLAREVARSVVVRVTFEHRSKTSHAC
jgi:deazaflavin-dependent oxidoreductase (nitroreductase family)